MFMSGNPREQKYPFHYMESAITTYLQSCKYVLFYFEMVIAKKIFSKLLQYKEYKFNKVILFPSLYLIILFYEHKVYQL